MHEVNEQIVCRLIAGPDQRLFCHRCLTILHSTARQRGLQDAWDGYVLCAECARWFLKKLSEFANGNPEQDLAAQDPS